MKVEVLDNPAHAAKSKSQLSLESDNHSLTQIRLKETAGGEFRVYRASIRHIDLLQGSYNGNYPPEMS